MSPPRVPPDDILGCRAELRAAATRPEQSAYVLARALGRCRLFGIDPGPEARSWTSSRAVVAARELLVLLERWIREARSLGMRWESCADPVQADELCLQLLEQRMDAWAGFVAIDEAYSDWLETGAEAPGDFSDIIGGLLDALDLLDAALQAEEEVLSSAVTAPLLETWCSALAEAFREPLPWWLSGRLEEAARRSEARALATLPGPALWRRLHATLSAGRGYAVALLPPLPIKGADPTVLPGRVLLWLSPDQVFRAVLVLPGHSTPTEETRRRALLFQRSADDAPAVLTGTPVRLGAAVGTIDGKGKAWFTLADLRAAGELVLKVGKEGRIWEPTQE